MSTSCIQIPAPRARSSRAITLVEVIVSIAVMAVLLGILLTITSSVSETVGRTSSKIDAFAGARAALNTVAQRLGQATLNTFWDYDDPLNPTVYRRESNLQILVKPNAQNSGYGQEIYFVSPQNYVADNSLDGTDGLLNACSFYVQFGGNAGFRPSSESASPQRYRYRLMQGVEPADALSIFDTQPPMPRREPDWTNYFTGFWNTHAWIDTVAHTGSGTIPANVTPLIDNVIACVFWPRLPIADDETGTALSSDFTYDSKQNFASNPQPITANQLPPTVQVLMILISEASAARLDSGATPPSIIENALDGRFARVDSFQDDLDEVTGELARNGIEFQVLNTSIALRESKWSDSSQ